MSDCVFCKIAAGDIPTDKVHEDDDLIACRDVNPQAPVHLLVIPRRHIASLNDVSPGDGELLGKVLLLAKEVAAKEGIDQQGYRVVNNCGPGGGQEVFHIHFHILGGRAMRWPPG
jgi:histidine triad (HIT) family protein